MKKYIDDIVVVIQARLGSQRIPAKMLKPFAGTTLMDIAIEKILNSKVIPNDNFYVSVYEPELVQVCEKWGANVFYRSEKSAFSEGTPMTEMYEWWDKMPSFKYCVLVNACAPFLNIETIDNFVLDYANSNSDGMFGVIEKKNYFWNENKKFLTPLTEAVMNTKTAQKTYEAAHCLYAGKMDKIGKDIWMGDFNKPGDIELFPMQERECFDIDYDWQFQLAESLMKTQQGKN
jgi:CMP-N-acetylneuraminic acid synthetase